jgi:hypothetical protein
MGHPDASTGRRVFRGCRFAIAFFAAFFPLAAAAAPPEEELRHLRNLSGCFTVTYTFFEDGKHDTLARGRPLGPITEWVGYREEKDGAYTLTHASITEGDRVVPHFHEIWRHFPRIGAWSQEVRRGAAAEEGAPPQALRYACTAPWANNLWKCRAGEAPKPFRDSGAPFGHNRTDYDVLDRDNAVLVTPAGWVHNEHNRKMTDKDVVVAQELGWIEYRRIDAKQCAAAEKMFPREAR